MTLLKMETGDRFVASSAEVFNRYGVDLEIGYDFEEYRTLLAEARPDHTLGAPFDPRLQPVTSETAFWIIGRNTDRQIVHTQAMRIVDLGGHSMGEYFGRHFRDFPPSVPGLNLERSRCRVAPALRHIYGRCCYDGEFWIAPGEEGLRGRGVSCVLGRYGFYQAMQHWDPDIIMAFMANPVAMKGLAERTGWMHTIPGAVRWAIDGRSEPVEGFMAYMQRDDLHYVLDLPLKDLVALVA